MSTQNRALQTRTQPSNKLVGINGGRNSITKLNMSELKELAEVFMQSGAFPDIKSTAQAIVKVLAGSELGFSPIVSMTGIHFFQGKVTIGANLLASLIKDGGRYEYKILQHTSEICQIAFYQHINGELKSLGTPVTYTFVDARNAGLTGKDNWKKYPMDMLFAACIRQGARRYCADIFRGTGSDSDTTIDENYVTSDMDDAAAQNVTIDAEQVEAVDVATGAPIEAEAYNEPEFTGPQEPDLDSETEDLRSLVTELLGTLPAARQKDILAGKNVVSKSNYDELIVLKDILENEK